MCQTSFRKLILIILLACKTTYLIFSIFLGDVNKIYERIEDVIAQADEVDGKLLQFEGKDFFVVKIT